MEFNNKKLLQARRELKLSCYSAARELSKSGMDISHQTILNWEKGRYSPDCRQITEICLFYGKPVGFFFTGVSQFDVKRGDR